MQNIVIERKWIHTKAKLGDSSGTVDYLGALILAIHPNENIIDVKRPSEIKKLLYPFTIKLRGIMDSKVTIDILQQSSLPQRDAEPAIIKTMAQFGYEVSFV